MISIKQLSTIDPSRWPNVIHMGYMTEVMRRTAQEWTAQNPCPAKLQPYLTAVENGYEKEDRLMLIIKNNNN